MKSTTLLVVTFAVWLGSATSKPTEKYDTIVVGLGSSGVTAASTLAKAGRRVLGLEADNRIGGRVKTVPFGDGVVEVGAEWIHGTVNSRVYDAAVENNVTTLDQELASQVYRSDRSFIERDLFNELIEYGNEVAENVVGAGTPKPLGDYITGKLMEYLGKNHPDVLKDQEYVNEVLEILNLSLSGLEASTDWNELSTQSLYEDLGGSLHYSWHKLGYKTFFEILLNKYNNGPGLPSLDIKLNKEVTQIKWPQESAGSVEVTCGDGQTYTADNVIVTVSLGVLKERYSKLFQPALPQIESIQAMSMGLLDKIIFKFDEPWWKSMPYNSMYFVWTSEDKKKVSKEDYWTTKIFGANTPMGSDHALTLWISGDNAKLMEALPEEVVREKSLGVLRRFMGANFTIPEPTAMIRSAWYSNALTRGSYSFDNIGFPQHPTARNILGEPLVDSVGNLKVLFAGEATNPTHYGTVHGASETGRREALRLLPDSKQQR